MKHAISYILAVFLVSTLLLNCNCRHLCTSPTPMLNFVNFDSAGLNAVVVKQYNNNGQFNDLRHTAVYSSMVFNNTHIPGPDTSHLDPAGIYLEYFTDYVIEVPAAGKTWHIRNLSVQPAKMTEQYCTNGVAYYLNDTLHTIPAMPTSSSATSAVIYLSK